MTVEPRPMFLEPMGFAISHAEGKSAGQALVTEHLLIPGTERIRSSVLACWADVVSGAGANHIAGGQAALTVDLTIRLLAPPVATRVEMSSDVLKAGRTTIFCEARLTNERGVTFAVSHMTFQSSPRPQDTVDVDSLSAFARIPAPVAPTYPEPFFDYIGLRHPALGLVELERTQAVMNPAGTIQGGAVAAMVEAAAEDRSGPVGDLELHFLKAIRTGPGRATAASLRGGSQRVEVRDPGTDDRLCTIGLTWPAAET